LGIDKTFRGLYPLVESFKPITLEEQALFSDIFAVAKTTASEFTFPYLYMWKRDYNLRYAMVEDHLLLISESRTYPPFAFAPVSRDGSFQLEKYKKAVEAIEEYFKEREFPLRFGRVEESCLEKLKLVYGERMIVEELDSTWDYVYNASDLIHLAGKKYSSKRNHISQFIRKYGEYEYIPVHEGNLDVCKQVLDEWCDKHETCVHPDNCERLACYELLDNWHRFPLKGALIKVNGRYEALTIGELLNPETAVIRVEKGNADIHGIYTLINRDFCAHEWQHVKYINREEDMGIEGLRKSKLSYNPAFMVRKFLVKVPH
jgi:hypothetical protein